MTLDFFWKVLPRELVKPMETGVDTVRRVQVGKKNSYSTEVQRRYPIIPDKQYVKIIFSAVDCGHPPTPRNGTVQGERTNYPNILRFKCDEGFTLLGSATRKCVTNGTWSGVDPICQGTL